MIHKFDSFPSVSFQLGCYVPARTAQFRLTDKILSRIGFGDRIECNLSGFVLEVSEDSDWVSV